MSQSRTLTTTLRWLLYICEDYFLMLWYGSVLEKVGFGLGSLFNGISTFVGYFMSNLLFEKNDCDII